MADMDDDWEYEYDENETENFYIPIDLSNVPSAQIPMNNDRRPGHPTLLKSRLRALNATRGQAPEMPLNASSAQETTTMGELQLTGLHTSNPLIMYNGQLLSCHWTSTVGTDMFFTKPEPAIGGQNAPLRTLPSVNLLSLGTTKLVAKVGRLRPRDELFESDNEETTQAATQNVNETAKDQATTTAPSGQDEGNETSAGTTGAASTGFLTRLNEVKAKRGETSRLSAIQTPEGTRLVTEHVTYDARPKESDTPHPTEDVTMSGT